MSALCVEQDGIFSPETDSGFNGTESRHPTPTGAPSLLHQGAIERWDRLLCLVETTSSHNKRVFTVATNWSVSVFWIFVTVLQWFTTGIPRTQTVVWLHHYILILCCQAVARLQSLGQRPSSIQSNRGEPNPERDRGEGPSPALISPGLKKTRARWATLSHRVSFYFRHVCIYKTGLCNCSSSLVWYSAVFFVFRFLCVWSWTDWPLRGVGHFCQSNFLPFFPALPWKLCQSPELHWTGQ